jgi:hypothetical protein
VATLKIVIIKEGPKGLFGYVADDQIEGYASNLLVYFDSRFLAGSAAVSVGDRCEFSYDLANRGSKMRMRFDSMRLLDTTEKEK